MTSTPKIPFVAKQSVVIFERIKVKKDQSGLLIINPNEDSEIRLLARSLGPDVKSIKVGDDCVIDSAQHCVAIKHESGEFFAVYEAHILATINH